MTSKTTIVCREYEDISNNLSDSKEKQGIKDFVIESLSDDAPFPILQIRNDEIRARGHVGILTTENHIIEILPKIDLDTEDASNEQTRACFLKMLRTCPDMKFTRLSDSDIKSLKHFPMLEVFVRLFLETVEHIVKRGIARSYETVEDNLSYLKGRIVFPEHIRRNNANQARIFVAYDEFTANRPANRLIHRALIQLRGLVKDSQNIKIINRLRIAFDDIPPSTNYHADWQKHKIDRMMLHYDRAMQWVRLFLFNHGLATFRGQHTDTSLLFRMHDIFESFVADSFNRYQRCQKTFVVKTQGPRKYLAIEGAGNTEKEQFPMRPDIHLSNTADQTKIVLDTKWKRIDSNPDSDISRSDLYQVFTYGKKYGCQTVGLIYPKTDAFFEIKSYRLDADLSLKCYPFDVTDPQASIDTILQELGYLAQQAA